MAKVPKARSSASRSSLPDLPPQLDREERRLADPSLIAFSRLSAAFSTASQPAPLIREMSAMRLQAEAADPAVPGVRAPVAGPQCPSTSTATPPVAVARALRSDAVARRARVVGAPVSVGRKVAEGRLGVRGAMAEREAGGRASPERRLRSSTLRWRIISAVVGAMERRTAVRVQCNRTMAPQLRVGTMISTWSSEERKRRRQGEVRG